MPDTFTNHTVSSFEPYDVSKARGKRKRNRTATTHENAPKQRKPPFERVVQLTMTRDRSSKELEDRLLREGYSVNEVIAAVKRAQDCDLVDDLRFADAFIRGRVHAGKGAMGIRREMAMHGIVPERLEGWPDAYGLDRQSQVENAVAILMRNPPHTRDITGAAYRKLVSKGYEPSISSQAVRIWRDSSL